MINISEAAAQEIKRLQKTQKQPDSYLRLTVKDGGCSGLYYVLEFHPNSDADESIYQSNNIFVIIDSHSLKYLNGVNIDYTEDLMGGSFQFNNPHATSVCGCGNSFATDDELA